MHGIKNLSSTSAKNAGGGAYARGGVYLRDTTVHELSFTL